MSFFVHGFQAHKDQANFFFFRIANKIYKTDVFRTFKLVNIIGICDKILLELLSTDNQNWRTSLSENNLKDLKSQNGAIC